MEKKLFTVSEANQALPKIARILQTLREGFAWLEGHRPPSGFVNEEHRVVNEGPVDPEYFGILMRVRRCLRDLGTLGVQVKDIRSGLVDFPAKLDGRDVLLCWRLGEKRVGFWHDLEAGFAGRQPLPEQASRVAGRDDEGIH